MSERDICQELGQNFLDFAYEANSQRAFPDARDGLKPGQRACIWEMYKKGYTSNKPHVKSAKISGGVIASWWPHGSTAIYETFGRMSQSWINNNPEVDWHGANGNQIMGSSLAADRYCITGDTLIKTNIGTIPIAKLEEFAEGEILNDINVFDFEFNEVPATKFFNCGEHPVIKITLKNGQNIKTTTNHPILTCKDSGEMYWKLAEDYKVGDKVLLVMPKLNNFSKSEIKEADNWAKALGCLISEGYITTQNRSGINNTDYNMIVPVKDFFESIDEKIKASISYNEKRGYYEYCIASQKIQSTLKNEYHYSERAKDKTIPDKIFTTTLKNKAAFLSYLFEGDGSVREGGIFYSSYSKKLVEQIQIILSQDFGIFSSILGSERKTGTEYKLRISNIGIERFYSLIGFQSERKNKILKEASLKVGKAPHNSYYFWNETNQWIHEKFGYNKYSIGCKKSLYRLVETMDPINFNRLANLFDNYIFVEIKSIEEIENETVYSVRVDNESSDHSYIANGFINHNTEARLSKITEEGMLQNINKKNVNMISNFSEDDEWPEVLPSIFPRLLVNGSQGIGLTIANVWLPHNLNDVIKVLDKYMETEELDYNELYPSFPTGGVIVNKNEISNIYKTGKGKVVLRGKAEVKGKSIFITELPYQVYVEPFIEQVKQLIINDEIIGAEDAINRSDKNGLLIEIPCDGVPENVLTQLFNKTDLQSSYNANQWALVSKTPMLLTLEDYCKIYKNHNLDCLKREVNFDLEKTQKRLHIVDGLLIALEDIDNVIRIIKSCQNAQSAKIALMANYKLSEVQAQAILDMKLSRLAHLEKIELEQEKKELIEKLNELNEILSSEKKQVNIIRDRLHSLGAKYSTERKTSVEQVNLAKEKKEKPLEKVEKCYVIEEDGYIRRSFSYSSKGIQTDTLSNIVVFTSLGKMNLVKVKDIPDTKKGINVSNLITLDKEEKVVSFIPEFNKKYICFATKGGLFKKSLTEEYISLKKTSTSAIKLVEGDELVSVELFDEEPAIIITKNGYSIHFETKDIASIGRNAKGVKGIDLHEKDFVISLICCKKYVTIITDDFHGKKVDIKEFPLQGRGGKGVICSPTTISKAYCGDNSTNLPIVGKSAKGNKVK